MPASKLLTRMRDRLNSPTQRKAFLTACVTSIIAPSVRENILSGGRPAFAPLSPRTILLKSLRGQPLVPGIATRAMLTSLTPGAAGNVTEVDGNRAIYGTSISYASKFEHGDPSNHQPARPFLMTQPEDRERMKQAMGRWAMTGELP